LEWEGACAACFVGLAAGSDMGVILADRCPLAGCSSINPRERMEGQKDRGREDPSYVTLALAISYVVALAMGYLSG